MDIQLFPSVLGGDVNAIASKSDLHRIMICAALCDREVTIDGVTRCADTDATAKCIEALGAKVTYTDRECIIVPPAKREDGAKLDCGESGSTLRFLLPVATVLADRAELSGHGRLPQRPIAELVDTMEKGGVVFSDKSLPLTVSGKLRAGNYAIAGNVSSQYISGLLMALSATEGESMLKLITPLQSASYVDMTINTLKLFGAEIEYIPYGYKISGKKRLCSPQKITVDGDWSNGAFFLASGAISNSIKVKCLYTDSAQGDRKILDILADFGADIKTNGDEITVLHNKLCGCTIDLTDIPDLLPILAVVASFAEGQTQFVGGERLRLKESDRLETTAAMLRSLGGKAEITADGLIVYNSKLTGGEVDGANDHRIVMAASIAAAYCENPVKIKGAEAVKKSYPDFFKDYIKAGGKTDGINLW